MSIATCEPCDIDFGTNYDAYREHMTNEHNEPLHCSHCSQSLPSGGDLASHVIEQHINNADNTSGGVEGQAQCPMCDFVGNNADAVQLHFDMAHEGIVASDDIAQPAASTETCELACPMCSLVMAPRLIDAHVEEHMQEIDRAIPSTSAVGERITPDIELQRLRREHGMDSTSSYARQGSNALNRAHARGQVSLADYYEQRLQLNRQNVAGVETQQSVDDLFATINRLTRSDNSVLESRLCSETVLHYATDRADQGFGCGYRNIQMLMSALTHKEEYRQAVWKSSSPTIPSVPKLQQLIETAWAQGFDAVGAAQLEGQLQNTRKWIGATEVGTLFHSFRIKTELVEFRTPINGRQHPQLFEFVWTHFDRDRAPFRPPIYCQFQGHSITIIGIERVRNGPDSPYRLLVFDPSTRPDRMQELVLLSTKPIAQRLRPVRKALTDMKSDKYQLVVLKGLIDSDSELEAVKRQAFSLNRVT